ncbi:MAG: site-specific integrase [Elusimicrobiota bacterium]
MIRSVFNRARMWGDFYGENPALGVKADREPAHRLRYLSRDEMDRLLRAAHPRLRPVLLCALLTGMRRGEILGLDWENVDLERGLIYVLKSKSGKPREIPIAGKLRDVLAELIPRASGSVFGFPYITLRRLFARALREAGIHSFRFHDLRHTFASHFIMRTNDLPTLQALLGHSTPAMTRRYAHLSRGHLASEMAAFESAIPATEGVSAPRIAPILHQGLSRLSH